MVGADFRQFDIFNPKLPLTAQLVKPAGRSKLPWIILDCWNDVQPEVPPRGLSPISTLTGIVSAKYRLLFANLEPSHLEDLPYSSSGSIISTILIIKNLCAAYWWFQMLILRQNTQRMTLLSSGPGPFPSRSDFASPIKNRYG